MTVLTSECPLCRNAPHMRIGLTAFCGNLHCKVISWDIELPLDQLLFGIHFFEWPTECHHE